MQIMQLNKQENQKPRKTDMSLPISLYVIKSVPRASSQSTSLHSSLPVSKLQKRADKSEKKNQSKDITTNVYLD